MRTLILAVTILMAASQTFAQSEAGLAQQFEGKQVKVKLDMPATKDGIDISANANEPLNWKEYASRLKQHGRGIRAGDTTVITSVKAKGKHIEIQLGGGGYGTLEDSLKTIVVPPPISKKDGETDADRRREERLLGILARGQQEAKRSQAEKIAQETGSRFNMRFQRDITPADLNPDAIKQALAPYLDFQP